MNEAKEKVLDRITAFAARAHGDQRRKYTPEPYICHPVRVMTMCRQYTDELPVLAAAILHDVLEDTSTTRTDIAGFLNTEMSSEEVLQTISLVSELTDVYVKTAYPQWNRRKRKAAELKRMQHISARAQTIKYADIYDNADEIVTGDPGFAPVYFYTNAASFFKR
jgi:guanosine-3',5'-bis(diphosphate) 3'-pyrophosphohydrolase